MKLIDEIKTEISFFEDGSKVGNGKLFVYFYMIAVGILIGKFLL